jgi:hypothetical protein
VKAEKVSMSIPKPTTARTPIPGDSFKKVSISIPKTLVKAIAVSLLAQVVLGSLFQFLILPMLSFTPEHKADEFSAINHGNPIVYMTTLMQQLFAREGRVDSYIATPIVWLLSGIVFTQFLPAASWSIQRVVKSAIIVGALLSVCVLVLGFVEIQLIEQLKNLPVSPLDPTKLPIAAAQTVFYTLAFVVGSLAGLRLRKTTPA